MIQLLPILIFFSFLSGQTNSKCGIIPENETLFSRDSQNWGYGYDSLLVDLDRWNESPFVSIDSLGASVQNRAIWELTITDDPESSTNHRIYIHTRTHPGEEESFWVTNEIINILLSDTPLGDFLRVNFTYHIIPMYNPDGVELGYPRNNANGIDIESGWDDVPLEPEVAVLQNRFIDLMWNVDNPIEVALNMHSAYACLRYFVYHASEGTSSEYTGMEQLFINSVRSHFPGGIEPWSYFVSWTSGTPDQYPESWWWMNHGQNVLALTYEDMNCDEAGLYDSTANAIVRGIINYLGLDFTGISEEKGSILSGFVLEQNYPNPFNSITTIQYSLPQEDKVTLILYDLKGSQIKTLINDRQIPGVKTLMWNGKNDAGKPVPSGIYLYTMASGNIITTRKMIFLK
jgi:hypothetical protein